MKTAVLVSGMYREFDIAVKSWNFLKDIDCDIYFSTWEKSVQNSEILNIHIEEHIQTSSSTNSHTYSTHIVQVRQ